MRKKVIGKISCVVILIASMVLLCSSKIYAGGGSDAYMSFWNEDGYKIVYSKGVVYDDAIENVKYDKNTNTLTLNNVNTDRNLYCQAMGKDFNLKVIGNNSIGAIWISAPEDGSVCNFNIIGNGTLTVNKEKKDDPAIYFESNEAKSKIFFGKDVNVNLYSIKNVIKVEMSTTADTASAISFENKENNVTIKKEKSAYDYNITTAEKYDYTVAGTYLQIKSSTVLNASLSKTKYTYNKKVQKPTVKVKDASGKVLKNGIDYKVSYSNKDSKKVGKYTVTIKYIGKYSGEKKLTYVINPKGTSFKKIAAGKKQFKATWAKQTAQTTGYEIKYSTNKGFKSENKTIKIKNNKTTSKTVKSLKAKKKYYVKVRTYKVVNGKTFYSGWSSVRNVTTKK